MYYYILYDLSNKQQFLSLNSFMMEVLNLDTISINFGLLMINCDFILKYI